MSAKRWIAYFDILGFSHRIETTHPDIILEIYNKLVRLSQQELESAGLFCLYFSDTFIFYSMDDTPKSYSWIQVVAKNFIRDCLREYVPFRGAIAFDEFYVDLKKGIFFGKALVEAHREAESQDWIGLILAKSAEEKVREYRLKTGGHGYPMVDVPTYNQYSVVNVPTKIQHPVYDFHRNGNVELTLKALEEMQKTAPLKAKHKYQNTIDFIKKGNICKKGSSVANVDIQQI